MSTSANTCEERPQAIASDLQAVPPVNADGRRPARLGRLAFGEEGRDRLQASRFGYLGPGSAPVPRRCQEVTGARRVPSVRLADGQRIARLSHSNQAVEPIGRPPAVRVGPRG